MLFFCEIRPLRLVVDSHPRFVSLPKAVEFLDPREYVIPVVSWSPSVDRLFFKIEF